MIYIYIYGGVYIIYAVYIIYMYTIHQPLKKKVFFTSYWPTHPLLQGTTSSCISSWIQRVALRVCPCSNLWCNRNLQRCENCWVRWFEIGMLHIQQVQGYKVITLHIRNGWVGPFSTLDLCGCKIHTLQRARTPKHTEAAQQYQYLIYSK